MCTLGPNCSTSPSLIGDAVAELRVQQCEPQLQRAPDVHRQGRPAFGWGP